MALPERLVREQFGEPPRVHSDRRRPVASGMSSIPTTTTLSAPANGGAVAGDGASSHDTKYFHYDRSRSTIRRRPLTHAYCADFRAHAQSKNRLKNTQSGERAGAVLGDPVSNGVTGCPSFAPVTEE